MVNDDEFRPRMQWALLTEFLIEQGEDQSLTYRDIERICRGPLPSSKQYPAFWSNSSQYAKHWLRAGFKVSRARCLPDEVRFLRTSGGRAASEPVREAFEVPDAQRRLASVRTTDKAGSLVILVGCVKTKRDEPAEARSLYVSPLFLRRRVYAEEAATRWFVLSAEFGLVAPDEVISPYDTYLPDMDPAYRRAWGSWCVARLAHLVGDLRGKVVEIHAGEAYVSSIREPLESRGARLRTPLEGLRQGEQLAWYDASARSDDADETHAPLIPTGGADAYETSPQEVAAALLAFRISGMDGSDAEPLGGRGEAGHLLATDPFAFLVAVIFDEGIVAERAWEAPLELKRRLGHLNPEILRRQWTEVAEAVARRPALHRYVALIPEAVCLAASRVCDVYGGDAGRIWADGTPVAEVDRRLRQFKRIGQKKAAMAVEILLSKYGADLPGLEQTDIAYDVQVRRVFLRSGIVDRDDQGDMVAAARRLQPDRPGFIDAAAWYIGRVWCRPTGPLCGDCPISHACARRTWLGP